MTSILANNINLQQTKAFIAYNPVTVVLTRAPRVPDGTGGWRRGAPFTADSATCRLLGFTGQDSGNLQRVSDSGAVVTVTHTLICMPEFDVKKGDTFTLDDPDVVYEILTVNNTPPWRKECEVYSRGE